ncbi:hypothetical protein AZ34_04170 [Hylemonella gracilis str. Niagara R]|uniref:Uncharacterized protein n=1 Tax=Hylemonella gracilis str. Niagara R TaxID=1458275 RepID=A0A016XLR5_9BURK|nr:hypothetical protein [Hylemonella gracilis]EYC52786.1 hypothetical protein AZ34_04170 [Hylemonella gracilis str. Niagara R]
MLRENYSDNKWQVTVVIALGILILLRFALSTRLPVYIISDSPHDDAWVVKRALYILQGRWLGPYDQFTLIKGPFSPLLMAFASAVGVTFTGLNTALYCFACVVFVAAVRPLIKSQWLLVFCFGVLLFNPLSYAIETGQRIYRNGIGQWEILLIFACLIAVFLRRDEEWKKLLKWVLVAGLTLGAFFLTREDAAWIYPFVFGAVIFTVAVFLLEKKGARKKVLLFVLPLVIAWSVSGLAALANYARYGALLVNDRNGGNYAKVAGDLHAIAPNEEEDRFYRSEIEKGRYFNIYVSTMEKALAASPTLNSASQPIRASIRQWAGWGEHNNGQLWTDHMLFALRDGVREAGYYRSLPETEAFFGKVHQELQAAFENGSLAKQGGFSVSPLIKRVHVSDVGKSLSLMPQATLDIIGFRGASAEVRPATGNHIQSFSLIAGGEHITSRDGIIGAGWAFAVDDRIRLNAGLYQQDVLVATVPFVAGKDVFSAFNFKYKNAELSRFSFDIDKYGLQSGVSMRFYDQNGKLFWELPLEKELAVGNPAACGGKEGVFHYCFDRLTRADEPSLRGYYDKLVKRANRVIRVYQELMPYVSVLACLAYLAATISLVRDARKKQAMNSFPVWLLLTGVATTFALFVFSMCLITATSFHALHYLYTAPAYILHLMFCVVSVAWGGDAFLEMAKRSGLVRPGARVRS